MLKEVFEIAIAYKIAGIGLVVITGILILVHLYNKDKNSSKLYKLASYQPPP